MSTTTPPPVETSPDTAAAALRRGELAVLPTETVYGLAGAVTEDAAFDALQRFKGHDPTQPAAFSLHVGSVDAALRLLPESCRSARRLVRKAMPGPLTLLLEVGDTTRAAIMQASGWSEQVGARLIPRGVLGLRCPDHPLTRGVLEQLSEPVVASSACPPGKRVPQTADEAAAGSEGVASVVLDGGRCRFGKPSTVVRVKGDTVSVAREGVFDERWIRKAMTRTALFVCTGNTCRSPMAAALARRHAAEALGVPEQELDASGVVLKSAGAFAGPGAAATPEAVAAANALGGDLSAHRSRPLAHDMLQEADRVWCMTASHRDAVLQIAPWAQSKVELLDPRGGDISDPYGGDAAEYQRCAKQINDLVRERIHQWLS